MKYQVAYLSHTGNTKKLASEIASALPPKETELIDLAVGKGSDKADAYIIGFGINRGVIPLAVINFLEHLEGKTILFLVTCAFEPTDEYMRQIENKLIPFLPEKCDYRGLLLCRGQLHEEIYNAAYQSLRKHGAGDTAEKLAQSYKGACGHPDEADIERVRALVKQRLELE